MTNPVSPWAIAAHSDIQDIDPIEELQLGEYELKIYNTGICIWITAEWPNGGSVGFRPAFCFSNHFTIAKISKTQKSEEPQIDLDIHSKIGDYRVRVSLPKSDAAMFQYKTWFKPNEDLFIPFYPRDILPIAKSKGISEATGKVHVQQIGQRSGHLFMSLEQPKTGSVFYFQNLSAISDYCQATETSAGDSVGGSWPEIGYRLPIATQKPLPAGKEVIICDAFVLLTEEIPRNPAEVTQQFLNHLADVYLALPKPDAHYQDWPEISSKGLNDLQNNKGSWFQANGKSYLNAYVCDYKTPPEAMVQLAVAVPLLEMLEWKGEDHVVLDELLEGLEDFYDKNIGTLNRWLPLLHDNLDKSEEQKREMIMDSWYLHHPLMNLARLALKGNSQAKELLLKSIDYAIKVAHEFDYQWPVFYKMDTLQITKAETEPGEGGEKDVPGSYAHLMLQLFDLTKDKKFYEEALKAAARLDGMGFDIFYQANNTAFAAGAMLRLFKDTNDQAYLDIAYACLAGIFKNVQIWQANYGNAKNYPTFFGAFPLNEAPYTAAYEELEVFAALLHFLRESEGVDILPSVRLLISEYAKYFVFRLPYYYPPMLPEDVISKEVKTGEIDTKLWIPLEDLCDGWTPSGQVGQEVYGAGAGFGVLSRQYFKIPESDFLVFSDYPVGQFKTDKNKSATLQLIGDGRLQAKICIIGSGVRQQNFKISAKEGRKLLDVDQNSPKGDRLEFIVPGDAVLKISWGA